MGLREDIHFDWSTVDVKRASIAADLGSAGDGDIVAAVAGKKIKLLSMYLVPTAASTFTLRSDTTGLSGATTTAASLAINLGLSVLGHVQTAAGEALNLLNGATGCNFRGFCTYAEID